MRRHCESKFNWHLHSLDNVTLMRHAVFEGDTIRSVRYNWEIILTGKHASRFGQAPILVGFQRIPESNNHGNMVPPSELGIKTTRPSPLRSWGLMYHYYQPKPSQKKGCRKCDGIDVHRRNGNADNRKYGRRKGRKMVKR